MVDIHRGQIQPGEHVLVALVEQSGGIVPELLRKMQADPADLGRAARAALQSLTLALGAYLVINGQASSGVIVASSILVSRALAPAELAISQWKGIAAARRSWARLGEALKRLG